MSTMSPMSNVYYLAPAAPMTTERVPRLSLTLRLRLRLLAFWWRLRLTATDVTRAARRFGRPEVDVDTASLDHRMILAAEPRPPIGPARIIDFAAARSRLRG